MSAKWSRGLYMEVEADSNDLFIVDQVTQMLQHLSTLRRVRGKQQWVLGTVASVEMVHTGAERDVSKVDVKSCRGRMLTPEETEEVAMNEAHRNADGAELWKSDFKKHEFSERSLGSSATNRGHEVQPHSQACRKSLETNLV